MINEILSTPRELMYEGNASPGVWSARRLMDKALPTVSRYSRVNLLPSARSKLQPLTTPEHKQKHQPRASTMLH